MASALLTIMLTLLILAAAGGTAFYFYRRHKLVQLKPAVVDPLKEFSAQVHGVCRMNEDGSSRQTAIRKCRGGEELELVPVRRKPNQVAIKICRMNTGEQLGYWPANDDRMVKDLQSGKKFHVTVDEIYPFPEKLNKFGVQIHIEAL